MLIAEDLHRRSQSPATSRPLPGTAELLADALEHAALLDALRRRDLPAAQQLASEHFTGV